MNKTRKRDGKREQKPRTEFLAVVALLDVGILTFVDYNSLSNREKVGGFTTSLCH